MYEMMSFAYFDQTLVRYKMRRLHQIGLDTLQPFKKCFKQAVLISECLGPLHVPFSGRCSGREKDPP